MSMTYDQGIKLAAKECLKAYHAYQNKKSDTIIQKHISKMTDAMIAAGDKGDMMDYIMEDIDPEQGEACAFVQGYIAGASYRFRSKDNK